MRDRKPDYPHYSGNPDTPCAQGDRVVLLRPASTVAYVSPHGTAGVYIGTVEDHELTPDGECEVRWDHTDTVTWWPADRLRMATEKEASA